MKIVPIRKCVATGESLPKKELLRIVKTPEGEIKIDLTGKLNGRGAYLKRDAIAINLAQKRKSLDRALQVKVPDKLFDDILTFIKQ
jgi:uncharacterized protein